MNTSFIFYRFLRTGRAQIYILSVLWLISLILGILLAAHIPPTVSVTIRDKMFTNPTPILQLVSIGLPIICVCVSLRLQLLPLVYPLIFAEGMSRGFCGTYLFLRLGSGAWLVRGLYLFSGSCTSVLIWWLLYRHTDKQTRSLWADVRFASLCAVAVAIVDICFISPFLSQLSIHF